MKATLTKTNGTFGRDYSHKDFESAYVAVAIMPDGEVREPVRVKIFTSKTGRMCYSHLMVSGDGYALKSSGFAGGVGYDKDACATKIAVKAAGIKLVHDDGREPYADYTVYDAVQAIAQSVLPSAKVTIVAI